MAKHEEVQNGVIFPVGQKNEAHISWGRVIFSL